MCWGALERGDGPWGRAACPNVGQVGFGSGCPCQTVRLWSGLEGLEDDGQLQDCSAGPVFQAQRGQELPLAAPGLSMSCWLLSRKTMGWGEKWIQLILMPTIHPPSGQSGDFGEGEEQLGGHSGVVRREPHLGPGGGCTLFGHLRSPRLLQLSI